MLNMIHLIYCLNIGVLITFRIMYSKELLVGGAPMDATNEEDQTPLHLASKHGKTEYATFYI